LLFATVVLVSTVEIDRTIKLIVDDLGASATTLINQPFNQIEIALSLGPPWALRRDPVLAALLASARAFSEGVTYVRLETGPFSRDKHRRRI
jgi:hypothetical protein